jgi:hypothetical protein
LFLRQFGQRENFRWSSPTLPLNFDLNQPLLFEPVKVLVSRHTAYA